MIINFPIEIKFFEIWFKKIKKIGNTKCLINFECCEDSLKIR